MDTSTSYKECINMPLCELIDFYSDYLDEIDERVKEQKEAGKR